MDEQKEELTIEEAFHQLNELITKMQADDIPLEESFACYEKGMKLVKYCSAYIDRVEKQVEKLNADGSLDEF